VPSNKPSVLFLNRSYWPDSEATGQLLTDLCEGLVTDFDVEVMSGLPNSVSAANTESWQTVSQRNQVRIRRLEHLTLPKRRLALKALNYCSFVQSARRELRSIPTPDVVVFETDPFLLAFEADRLRRRTGCRLIGYLQDIYPDVAIATGKIRENWLVKRLRKSLFSVYRACDQIVVLSRDMRQLLIDRGVNPDRIEIIPNWADTETIKPLETHSEFRARNGLLNAFVVMYSGNMGLTQRLIEFIDAARLTRDDAEIVYLFVGEGAHKAELQRIVEIEGLSNVRFLGYQPREHLAESLGAADLHLIPLTRECSRCLMPSKLYGVLAAGRAYLTNAVPGTELHDLTVGHETGFVVPPQDPAAIAQTIRIAKAVPDRLKQMGQNGRHLAIQKYTRTVCVTAFSRMLQKVLTHDQSARKMPLAVKC
jgi:colanic acid biosynthesis glycosyl transferase WcaI